MACTRSRCARSGKRSEPHARTPPGRGRPCCAGSAVPFETAKPTFASCWGFQALARALGGRVVTDHARAEVGVLPLHLTETGFRDPLFGPIGTPLHAVIGHEDIVDELPPGAVSLVSSDTLPNEAFTFPDKPIYAT